MRCCRPCVALGKAFQGERHLHKPEMNKLTSDRVPAVGHAVQSELALWSKVQERMASPHDVWRLFSGFLLPCTRRPNGWIRSSRTRDTQLTHDRLEGMWRESHFSVQPIRGSFRGQPWMKCMPALCLEESAAWRCPHERNSFIAGHGENMFPPFEAASSFVAEHQERVKRPTLIRDGVVTRGSTRGPRSGSAVGNARPRNGRRSFCVNQGTSGE